jgi:hypothetical protein
MLSLESLCSGILKYIVGSLWDENELRNLVDLDYGVCQKSCCLRRHSTVSNVLRELLAPLRGQTAPRAIASFVSVRTLDMTPGPI